LLAFLTLDSEGIIFSFWHHSVGERAWNGGRLLGSVTPHGASSTSAKDLPFLFGTEGFLAKYRWQRQVSNLPPSSKGFGGCWSNRRVRCHYGDSTSRGIRYELLRLARPKLVFSVLPWAGATVGGQTSPEPS